MSSSIERADQRLVRGEATRERILDAASDVLRGQGGAATTTRAVAERAGVRLSLVHYHFGGKGGLLAALLERENARLLERQHAMYAATGPLADKWRTACAYLREDLRSGYVRLLWELWAAGLADEELARRWRDAMRGWRELIEGAIRTWADEHQLALPVTPRALATLVANAFLGVEVEILAGVSEEEAPHLEALEACTGLIEWFERGGNGPSQPTTHGRDDGKGIEVERPHGSSSGHTELHGRTDGWLGWPEQDKEAGSDGR